MHVVVDHSLQVFSSNSFVGSTLRTYHTVDRIIVVATMALPWMVRAQRCQSWHRRLALEMMPWICWSRVMELPVGIPRTVVLIPTPSILIPFGRCVSEVGDAGMAMHFAGCSCAPDPAQKDSATEYSCAAAAGEQ